MKTLKLTDSQDRRELSGIALNNIINVNNNSTNHFFYNGNNINVSNVNYQLPLDVFSGSKSFHKQDQES
jgi:hypothetical protein